MKLTKEKLSEIIEHMEQSEDWFFHLKNPHTIYIPNQAFFDLFGNPEKNPNAQKVNRDKANLEYRIEKPEWDYIIATYYGKKTEPVFYEDDKVKNPKKYLNDILKTMSYIIEFRSIYSIDLKDKKIHMDDIAFLKLFDDFEQEELDLERYSWKYKTSFNNWQIFCIE